MSDEKGFEEIVIDKFEEVRNKFEDHDKRLNELEKGKPVIEEKKLEQIVNDVNPEDKKEEIEKIEDIKSKKKKDFIDKILSIKII